MVEEDAFKLVEKDLGSFQYVGEILATIKYHELASIKEVIEYYYKLWEVTEGLTDEELQKNEDKTVGIGVEVPKNAVSGSYILNADINNGNSRYAPTIKIYVDVT